MNAQEAGAVRSVGAASRAGRRSGPARLAGPTGTREALLVASCVLEVLAGMRRPVEAASVLGVSLARYYQLEQRALEALVQGCEPLRRGRGRGASAGPELSRLRHENERLVRECQRQQALVRLARQAAGLTAPAEPAGGAKKRQRKKSRGQQAAETLRQAAAKAETPAEAMPDPLPETSRDPSQSGKEE